MPAMPAADMPLEFSRGEGAGWCTADVVMMVLRRTSAPGSPMPSWWPGRRATVKGSWPLAMLPDTGAALATS